MIMRSPQNPRSKHQTPLHPHQPRASIMALAHVSEKRTRTSIIDRSLLVWGTGRIGTVPLTFREPLVVSVFIFAALLGACRVLDGRVPSSSSTSSSSSSALSFLVLPLKSAGPRVSRSPSNWVTVV